MLALLSDNYISEYRDCQEKAEITFPSFILSFIYACHDTV
jgi:hypothetical protein